MLTPISYKMHYKIFTQEFKGLKQGQRQGQIDKRTKKLS